MAALANKGYRLSAVMLATRVPGLARELPIIR
jgi:hypothetical protein